MMRDGEGMLAKFDDHIVASSHSCLESSLKFNSFALRKAKPVTYNLSSVRKQYKHQEQKKIPPVSTFCLVCFCRFHLV